MKTERFALISIIGTAAIRPDKTTSGGVKQHSHVACRFDAWPVKLDTCHRTEMDGIKTAPRVWSRPVKARPLTGLAWPGLDAVLTHYRLPILSQKHEIRDCKWIPEYDRKLNDDRM